MTPDSSDFRPNPLWTESAYKEVLVPLSAQLREVWLPKYSVQDRDHPGVIYHYTTTNGLIGILESNELWLTDLNYMNDASELEYARELIEGVIVTRLDAASGHPVLKTFYERAIRMLVPPGFRRFYAVCFCENGDLLSQWRAYGDRGGGYAIGLQANEIGRGSGMSLCIRKTIYDATLQRQLVETTLDRIEQALLHLAEEKRADPVKRIVPIVLHFLDDHLSEYTFTFKNEVFQEEQEWRVVMTALAYEQDEYRRLARFRSSGGMLVPYIAANVGPAAGVHTGRFPIARIVFGPTAADPELTSTALADLLGKHGYAFVEVAFSKIPLRG